MKRKMHEITTDIMTLQMGLSMASEEERRIELNELFTELYDKEDGIYWLYKDNEKKIDMVSEHIEKCKTVKKVIRQNNDHIKHMIISANEDIGSVPQHSAFNPIQIRQSNGAVEVLDESKIPNHYFITVEVQKLDKTRILKELKEGKKIPGVSLIKKPFISGLKKRSNDEYI
jgi:hypothetical protein|tara:strand:+ start:305 stop:820 length:516 start_codon:yes stop_codon:yes gene_type:complete